MTATSVPEESPPQRIPSLASIVITNWNGKHHLQRNLQSVLDAAKEFGGPTEIIVVDDASTDGSVDYLRAEFPGRRFILPTGGSPQRAGPAFLLLGVR
jgi:glycosyltransferase involved in cell wall biosynthesis